MVREGEVDKDEAVSGHVAGLSAEHNLLRNGAVLRDDFLDIQLLLLLNKLECH